MKAGEVKVPVSLDWTAVVDSLRAAADAIEESNERVPAGKVVAGITITVNSLAADGAAAPGSGAAGRAAGVDSPTSAAPRYESSDLLVVGESAHLLDGGFECGGELSGVVRDAADVNARSESEDLSAASDELGNDRPGDAPVGANLVQRDDIDEHFSVHGGDLAASVPEGGHSDSFVSGGVVPPKVGDAGRLGKVDGPASTMPAPCDRCGGVLPDPPPFAAEAAADPSLCEHCGRPHDVHTGGAIGPGGYVACFYGDQSTGGDDYGYDDSGDVSSEPPTVKWCACEPEASAPTGAAPGNSASSTPILDEYLRAVSSIPGFRLYTARSKEGLEAAIAQDDGVDVDVRAVPATEPDEATVRESAQALVTAADILGQRAPARAKWEARRDLVVWLMAHVADLDQAEALEKAFRCFGDIDEGRFV